MVAAKGFLTLTFTLSFASVERTGRRQVPAFTAADRLEIVQFSGGQPIALAPDGNWVADVLPDVNDEWNVLERRPVGYVYVRRLTESDSAKALSRGVQRSSFPVWSPNGEPLFFEEPSAKLGKCRVMDADEAG